MPLTRLRPWIAAATLLVAGAAHAYVDVVVFGDSLSDGGNVAALIGTDPGQVIDGNTYVPSMPYASGTFTNGATWVDGFAAALGTTAAPSLLGGTNYAFGGAQTRDESNGSPSLISQLGMYLDATGGLASSDSLYVLAGGGNNARAALEAIGFEGAPPLRTALATAVAYARDVGQMVDALQAAGATDIIVWNAPNIGLTPAVGSLGSEASFLAGVIGNVMNQALARRLEGEAGVRIFDVYGLVGAVAADPAAYGLDNVTDACGAAVNGCDPATALFWDGIHPTAAGHAILTDAMIAVAVPEPGTWALFVAGGAVLLARRRRRQAGTS
ncbi:MAG: SGNH/GDSL hydrolase family protein [Burkholderiaceae bacterium]|nr:SGNH/GDSL hydrolase family protein [Burkholderiaceae bacterium]